VAHNTPDSLPPRRFPSLANIVVSVAIFTAGLGVSALVGYGHDQKALAEHDARSASTEDIQRLNEKDAHLAADIAVLKAQRVEDSERLKNIERMVVEVYTRTTGSQPRR